MPSAQTPRPAPRPETSWGRIADNATPAAALPAQRRRVRSPAATHRRKGTARGPIEEHPGPSRPAAATPARRRPTIPCLPSPTRTVPDPGICTNHPARTFPRVADTAPWHDKARSHP
ncbi:hypothetical protein GCM10010277_87920 [Streptomyces longisporoflavus]|nr:hypothetical protein GCM10010277_87920 [Streptomyces longisporoflavus]